MGQFWIVTNKDHIDERCNHFKNWLKSEFIADKPVKWEVKPYSRKRSLSQNNLFHDWCDQLSREFTAKNYEVDKEQMKLILKNKFLGTQDIVIHNTVIEGQLRHTSDLGVGEMKDFMDQVWHWSADHGVILKIPADSEYMKLSNA